MSTGKLDSGPKLARHGFRAAGHGATDPHALRHWRLYEDWCEATGREPLPATGEILDEFLRQCPGSKTLTLRRLDAIRAMHERQGVPFAPLGDNEAPLLWRVGEQWLDLPGALSRLPTVGWTRGFTGRRDGFILVAAGELGLSRNRIRQLSVQDIEAGPGHTAILGRTVTRAEKPAECSACAVIRWLDVLGRLERDWRGGLRQHLALAKPSLTHACDTSPTRGWETTPTFIPSIDRYGWVGEGLALSTRSISAVLARRQDPEQARWTREEPAALPLGEREPEERCAYERERFDDIGEMLDALDARTEAALKKTERVLAEAHSAVSKRGISGAGLSQ